MTELERKTFEENKRFGGNTREFFSKLSRGLMVPIALLPIAGLFLGIFAGIENIMLVSGVDANSSWFLLTSVFKTIGEVVFANLPLLFAIGVAIAFTEDSGIAAFSAVVGWLTFNAAQSIFIHTTAGGGTSVLWYSDVPSSVITQNVGITSMNSSVFGGLSVGFLVAWVYNKFHTTQMPKVLGFFSGTRLVPILTFMFTPVIGFIFVAIWPAIGMGLESFGAALSKAPAQLDAFAFGFIERALIPFGLHHAFYTPLWYTSVGGSMYLVDASGSLVGGQATEGNQSIWFAINSAAGMTFDGFLDIDVTSLNSIQSALASANLDSSLAQPIYDAANKLGLTGVWQVQVSSSTGSIALMTEGVRPGAYMQGKYPIMMFGLPAAGLAMIHAVKGKENRQVAGSVIIAAAATSFLTGITEPIEYTFLFLAPWLFWGFHAVMAGLSFWILALLGSSVAVTFSGGIIDYSLYGILPDATGQGVHSYWIIAVGAVFAPIYYFVFKWSILRFDLKTPGRSEDAKMVTKADYLANKGSDSNSGKKDKKDKKGSQDSGPSPERVQQLLENLGGMENLDSIDACITRLRLSVNDRSKVNDEELKKMGAVGVVGGGRAIQVIFGAEADAFKVKLLAIKKGLNK